MATLMIKSEGFEERVLKLRPGTNRLGRGPESDFQIEHDTISALHCEVDVAAEALLVRDCGSTNGTFVDGEPIVSAKLTPVAPCGSAKSSSSPNPSTSPLAS